MTRLRWALARFVAPTRIVAAPPDNGAVHILMQIDGMTVWVQAATFELKHETTVPAIRHYAPGESFTRTRSQGTFSGTLAD